ncbi:ergothioneine biosynthesis protein EgtB [bacterium]|jgi:ergothioneine biosynthesis protein EgtB|nr:ergothioneine biosynthesis protein EgtB [bacterium]
MLSSNIKNRPGNTFKALENTLDPNSSVNTYLKCRQNTENICNYLEIEDYVVQPSNDVSPPKWHLGHTTWFFEEMILANYLKGYKKYNENFSKLFNSYYKAAGAHWTQSERGNLSRPTVTEIYDYRCYVDKKMMTLLTTTINNDDLNLLLTTGIQHEQQHQELLYMDIKASLSENPCLPIYYKNPLPHSTINKQKWIPFKKGIYNIGHDSNGFSYDNEKPQHKCYIHAFSISNKTITNGDYLKFIQANIYASPTYWLSLGWDWVTTNKPSSPLYWHQKDGLWFEFTLHGLIPLDLESPVVHINYFEANAYAAWAGHRLPTEHELEIYLTSHSIKDENSPPAERITTTQTNYTTLNLELNPEISLNRDPIQESPRISETYEHIHPLNTDEPTNQVWCWTQSHYSPYPGYKQFDGILKEYNGKFMCNQFVLKGGCVATPKNHSRPTYRNFYQPHQRWMFSGIRLAKDIQ